MNRIDIIKEILHTPKDDLGRIACSFMKTETLYYIVSLREKYGDKHIPNEAIEEPYLTDINNSYKKAQDEIIRDKR